MSKLICKIPETTLVMNRFPGWVDDPEWQKKIKKKANGISCIFLFYAEDPAAVQVIKEGEFYSVTGSDYGSSVPFGKSNLINGVYSERIDAERLEASVKIGGEFSFDANEFNEEDLSAFKAASYLFASGFTFSNSKNQDIDAQGHFSDSWDNVVAIECSVTEG